MDAPGFVFFAAFYGSAIFLVRQGQSIEVYGIQSQEPIAAGLAGEKLICASLVRTS